VPGEPTEDNDSTEDTDPIEDNDEDEIELDAEFNIENFCVDVEPIDVDAFDHLQSEQAMDLSSTWSGFKIVVDNIDKNLRRSFQRCDRQTVSLHYFHSCAVVDRIDFSHLSDVAPESVVIDPSTILPNAADLDAIKREFQVLVSR